MKTGATARIDPRGAELKAVLLRGEVEAPATIAAELAPAETGPKQTVIVGVLAARYSFAAILFWLVIRLLVRSREAYTADYWPREEMDYIAPIILAILVYVAASFMLPWAVGRWLRFGLALLPTALGLLWIGKVALTPFDGQHFDGSGILLSVVFSASLWPIAKATLKSFPGTTTKPPTPEEPLPPVRTVRNNIMD